MTDLRMNDEILILTKRCGDITKCPIAVDPDIERNDSMYVINYSKVQKNYEAIL